MKRILRETKSVFKVGHACTLPLFLVLSLIMGGEGRAQTFTYTNIEGTLTITGYNGPAGNIVIPSTIDGLPVTRIGDGAFFSLNGVYNGLTGVSIPDSVTSIGDSAFMQCVGLTNIVIPDSVTDLGDQAFAGCSSVASLTIGSGITTIRGGDKPGMFGTFFGCGSLTRVMIPDTVTTISDGWIHLGGATGAFYGCENLTNVTIGKGLTFLGAGAFNWCNKLLGAYFHGNAPTPGINMFGEDNFHPDPLSIIYYLPGTTGWGPTFTTRPTALWNPQAQISDGSLGVKQNRFGFNVAGTADIPIVIEASTNLASSAWVALQSCTLTNGLLYFSDADWTNYSGRYYRIRSP
jgi:hypothetical protein